MIKTILCSGDSHTWGQGAKGLDNYLAPAIVAGDLRLIPFYFGCYVNLLRNKINEYSNSFSNEFDSSYLSNLDGVNSENGCAKIEKTFLKLELIETDLLRIEFLSQTEPSVAQIFVDGKLMLDIDLQVSNAENAFRIFAFYLPDKSNHVLEVKSITGSVLVYRIETYGGEYAVINCGIGSCSSSKFVAHFWDDYITAYNPYCIIMEPHTINDWLSKDSPEVYKSNLGYFFDKARLSGAKLIMMTVSPILGSQSLPFNQIDYVKYIEASIQAANVAHIPIADAYSDMAKLCNNLSSEELHNLLFYDAWHVNDFGHEIYANIVYETLINNKFI